MAQIQIFGTKKCNDTRKAERFFKERRVPYQFIDLSQKGMSRGELASVKQAVGIENLIDREGRQYKERNFGYMDFDIEEELLEDPLLFKTPVVRRGRKAVVGNNPGAWKELAEEE